MGADAFQADILSILATQVALLTVFFSVLKAQTTSRLFFFLVRLAKCTRHENTAENRELKQPRRRPQRRLQKNNKFMIKTTALYVHHAFQYIFLTSTARLRRETSEFDALRWLHGTIYIFSLKSHFFFAHFSIYQYYHCNIFKMFR